MLKQSFTYNFLEWARVRIGVGSLSMLDFIDWLSIWMGFVSCVPLHLVWPCGAFVYTVLLQCTLLFGIINTIDVYL